MLKLIPAILLTIASPVLAGDQLPAPVTGTERVVDCSADSRFFQDRERGWFWRELCAERQKERKEKAAKPPVAESPPAPEQKKPEDIDVAWLRENLPKLLDRALNSNDEKDIRAFQYALQVALEMSTGFAEKASLMAELDPLLNATNRVPMATGAVLERMVSNEKYTKTALDRIFREKAVIWYFFRSTCEFCEMQERVLYEIKKKYPHVLIYAISLDGRPGHHFADFIDDSSGEISRHFNVGIVPTMTLTFPPDKVNIVSQGFMSLSGLERRMLAVALFENELRDEERQVLFPNYSGSPITDELKAVASDDPEILARNLARTLTKYRAQQETVHATE